MKWKAILNDVGKGVQIAAPVASTFGVPFASTVNEAVNAIYANPTVNNEDAVKLMSAQIDEMAKEIAALKAGSK